jgi:hypothetical protein
MEVKESNNTPQKVKKTMPNLQRLTCFGQKHNFKLLNE